MAGAGLRGVEETKPCFQDMEIFSVHQSFILYIWWHHLRQGGVKGSLWWIRILGSNWDLFPCGYFRHTILSSASAPCLPNVDFDSSLGVCSWAGKIWQKFSSVFCALQSPLLGTADQGGWVFLGIDLCGSSLQQRSSFGFAGCPQCLLFPAGTACEHPVSPQPPAWWLSHVSLLMAVLAW